MTTFEPSFDLIEEDDCTTILLYLPGFTKEQLRVQLTRTKVLKISGTSPDNRWTSFHKDFPVPENCDTNKITAKFEEGILYVRQPKVIVPDDKNTPPPPPPKPVQTPPSPPPKPAQHLPAIPKITPPPPPTPDSPKTTPKVDESKHEKVVKDFPEEKKEEEKQSRKDEKVTAGRKKDDSRKVTAAGKSEKVTAVYSSMVNAAGGLKMEREKVMKIAVVVFAFVLGMYVSNKLPNWFSSNN